MLRKECKRCKREFNTTRKAAKFCSTSCGARKHDVFEIACACCGKEFIPKRNSKQRFCSISCGAKNINYDGNLLLSDINNNELSVCEIASKYNVSESSVYNIASKHKISYTINNYSIALSERQRSLITGSLLGDCCASKLPSGKYRLQMRHGPKQFEYLDWKYSILQNIVKTPPRTRLTPNAYGAASRSFATITNEEISIISDRLYSTGKKKINYEYLEKLDTLALAIWMMDDGYLYKNGGAISSHSFTIEENRMIARWLSVRYNCQEPRLVFDKRCSKWYLALHTKLSHAIAEEISPEVFSIPTMSYKVSWYGKNNGYQKDQ